MELHLELNAYWITIQVNIVKVYCKYLLDINRQTDTHELKENQFLNSEVCLILNGLRRQVQIKNKTKHTQKKQQQQKKQKKTNQNKPKQPNQTKQKKSNMEIEKCAFL